MAEKEERILITKCDVGCVHSIHKLHEDDFPYGTLNYRPLGCYCTLEGGFFGCDSSSKAKLVTEQDCANCKHAEYNGLPRKEVIEKMAKGIVSILAVQPGTEPDPWEMWKDYAEAALNALLRP